MHNPTVEASPPDTPEMKPSYRLRLSYLMGITAVNELILCALGWFGLVPFPLLLGIHVVVAGTAALMLHYSRRFLPDIRLPLIYIIFLGIAGPLALPLYLCLYSTYRLMRALHDTTSLNTFTSPPADADAILLTAERIALGFEDTKANDNLEPWHDLLYYGDFNAKQRILARISRAYHPSYAPLLKQALADDDNAVRVVAATSLTKIEERYTRHILTAENIRSNSALATEARVKADCSYAAACIEWACAGLLDPYDRDLYFSHALNAIMDHEEEDIIRHIPLIAYVTLLLHSKEPQQALRVLDMHHDQESTSLRLKHLHMQACMQSGDYSGLRAFYKTMLNPSTDGALHTSTKRSKGHRDDIEDSTAYSIHPLFTSTYTQAGTS